MSKLLRVVTVGAVVCAALVWCQPIRNTAHRWRAALQSGTDDLAGRTAVNAGQQTRRRLVQASVGHAVQEYRALRGEEPQGLDDLVQAGLLQRSDVMDEWGRPLDVRSGANGLEIRSLGADGRRGTADDWTLGP